MTKKKPKKKTKQDLLAKMHFNRGYRAAVRSAVAAVNNLKQELDRWQVPPLAHQEVLEVEMRDDDPPYHVRMVLETDLDEEDDAVTLSRQDLLMLVEYGGPDSSHFALQVLKKMDEVTP